MKKTLLLLIMACFFVSFGCRAKTLQLNLMTFNVRYDNPEDSLNNWQFRRGFVAKMINFYDVDVLGTQEVLHNQLTDMLAALPQYAYAGVGRLDGKEAGEYSAVFYKKEKFVLLKSGNFWLSENPSAAGVKGWDAACERIVTWVILQEKTTGKKFAFINTHFDHIGPIARRESAKLLLSKVDGIAQGLPLFVSGDFNSIPKSEVITILTDKKNSGYLTDSRSIASFIYGPEWTNHAFGRVPMEKRRIIDYIFVKNEISVQLQSVVAEMLGNLYLSDHNPVLIKATF
jgi:endonuclease/exonuclease/phosphatase family metal-dependent hydrolase